MVVVEYRRQECGAKKNKKNIIKTDGGDTRNFLQQTTFVEVPIFRTRTGESQYSQINTGSEYSSCSVVFKLPVSAALEPNNGPTI